MPRFVRGFDDSALFYVQERRRRRWAQGTHGLQGYAQFLQGYGEGDGGEELGAVIGAGTAASTENAAGSSVWRSIGIGVATGAITFLINHWLGKALK